MTLKESCPVSRNDLIGYLNQSQVGTRLLFAGNLIHQPYMKDIQYRISGELPNTDILMKNSFWIGVQPSLTNEMLDYAATKIEEFLGVAF